ncbi:hypothetical protein [Streptomyces sp. NPDC093992]|uniref:hypothetical protein n=1 Tax=Streptomyces sp. NPDC093992 TaxID=3366053 RepID=UPI0038368BB7
MGGSTDRGVLVGEVDQLDRGGGLQQLREVVRATPKRASAHAVKASSGTSGRDGSRCALEDVGAAVRAS